MPFKNRIRLPMELSRPQFITERDEYRLANGITKTLSVSIRKVYEGRTDSVPEKIHERLIVALSHDDVTIEGDKYVGGVTLEGSYDIEWIEFLSNPLAQGKFKANVTPFNALNTNCGTCEEYSQVICEDDNIGDVVENEQYLVDVMANDSICCNPATLSVISWNSDYINTADVVGNIIQLETQPLMSSANGVVLATYRVTCENGLYDEANIIGNPVGTDPDPVCYAPFSAELVSLDSDTSATFSWEPPVVEPECGYHWEVRTAVGAVLASGDTMDTTAQATGLPSDENFLRFFVRSNCCDDFNSNYVGPVIFSLPPPSETETCGLYELFNTDFAFRSASYMDCNGDLQNVVIPGLSQVEICVLQTSANNPVELDPEPEINVVYLGLC